MIKVFLNAFGFEGKTISSNPKSEQNNRPSGSNRKNLPPKTKKSIKTIESTRKPLIVREMPNVPERIEHSVVVDYIGKIVHVTKKVSGDPLFMTWWRNVQAFDTTYQIKIAPLEEIDRLKRSGVGLEGQKTEIFQDSINSARRKAYDLLTWAVGIGATDIHVNLRENYGEIFARVKGSIKMMEQLPKDEAAALCVVLYQGFDGVRPGVFSPSQFQSAQISGKDMTRIGLSSIRLERGFAFPVDQGGQFVSARLQKYDVNAQLTDYVAKVMEDRKFPRNLQDPKIPSGTVDLVSTGLSEKQQEMLLRVSESANGIILLTGPTGSGKTSLLSLLMKHIAQVYPGKRQVSAEDPVEIPMDWVVQLPVANSSSDKQTGDAFAQYLRIMLRMDPDLIFLGELRGPEAAMAAFNAALTGHLVFSTLHVPDPYMAIDRFELMDNVRLSRKVTCDPKLIRALVAQRVIPVLCPHCSIPFKDSKNALQPWLCEAIETYGDINGVHVRGPGCSVCGDGIKGRTAVAEVVVTDYTLMDSLIENRTAKARREHRARPDTDNSMVYNAIMRSLKGEIDPRTILKDIDKITPKGKEDI